MAKKGVKKRGQSRPQVSKALQPGLKRCDACQKMFLPGRLTVGELLRPRELNLIRKRFPGFTSQSNIFSADLNDIRADLVLRTLEQSNRDISKLEQDVARSIEEKSPVSEDVSEEFEEKLHMGDKLADRLAEFGGSWKFIILFFMFIGLWVIINAYYLYNGPFDPYPFILLNLFLSMLAAIQAPIIMMSQNRQEARDRLRSEYEYKVNLKAELEIQQLNEKMDHLLKSQWKKMMEVQQTQADIMKDLKKR